MTKEDKTRLPTRSSHAEVDAFLQKVAATPDVRPAGQRGRLIFAMDATASRAPSWDQARRIQSEMFTQTAALGGLDIQLCYYRGFAEFFTSPWLGNADDLLGQMRNVTCRGGHTQIKRLLQHTLRETRNQKVNAMVFVGDCMEEDVDQLCQLAGELGILGLPVFVFQEGLEPVAEHGFREIAKLSNGAYCRFDADSAQQLRELLGAVAVYAAGGRRALEDFGKHRGGVALKLTHQIKRG